MKNISLLLAVFFMLPLGSFKIHADMPAEIDTADAYIYALQDKYREVKRYHSGFSETDWKLFWGLSGKDAIVL